MGEQKLWHFDQPHLSGGNAHITLTREQAITWMQSIYSSMSDEEALEYFKAVYWAWHE